VGTVAIVGAGVAGLTVGYELAKRGVAVDLFSSRDFPPTSLVAAGMLAPGGEANYGEDYLIALQMRAAKHWQSLSVEIFESSGLEIGYETRGTLIVAGTNGDYGELQRLAAFERKLGLEPIPVTRSELSSSEPLLSDSLAGGLIIGDDAQVDNRAFVSALKILLTKSGARFRDEEVIAIDTSNGALKTVSGTRNYDSVVVAAGARMNRLVSTDRAIGAVKGITVRVRLDPRMMPQHCVRGVVYGRKVYLVPRASGEMVIGATETETDWSNSEIEMHDLMELLEDAATVFPSIRMASLADISVGFRPQTNDNLPIAGQISERVWCHGGHFRHGILLAPYTATMLADAITIGYEMPKELAPMRTGANQ
jgi:glycine oxidase